MKPPTEKPSMAKESNPVFPNTRVPKTAEGFQCDYQHCRLLLQTTQSKQPTKNGFSSGATIAAEKEKNSANVDGGPDSLHAFEKTSVNVC